MGQSCGQLSPDIDSQSVPGHSCKAPLNGRCAGNNFCQDNSAASTKRHWLHVKRKSPWSQVAETATQFFITADRPNVAGLVLAGSADFKTELSQSDMFDQRLQAVILSVVDVSYGVLQLLTASRTCMLELCCGGSNRVSSSTLPSVSSSICRGSSSHECCCFIE